MTGKFESGAFFADAMLLESAFRKKPAEEVEKPPVVVPPAEMTEEQAWGLLLEAASARADQSDRAAAAAAVIEWAEGGDASWDAFDALAYGLALESEGLDPEDDAEIESTDDLNGTYNSILVLMAEAAAMFGADDADIATFIDEEDEEAGEKVMNAVSGIDEEEADDLIATFVAGGDEELFEAVKKVVRNGKVKLIKKKIRPRRMNGAQRAALKKARRKSNTSSAKMKRKKSMKIRKKRFGK